MAEGKKSFILYCDLITVVEKLVLKDRDNKTNYAGELFLHILKYVNDLNPIPIDFIIEMAFEPIKLQLKRDLDKYEVIREKRSIAGLKSASKRKQKQQVLTSVESVQECSTNSTVNDNDNVTVINNKYRYSKFYDSQLEKTDCKKYARFISFLFGDNEDKIKLLGVLSIRDQLTFEQFNNLLSLAESKKCSIMDILLKIENDKKYWKGKTSLNRTLKNWIDGRFING